MTGWIGDFFRFWWALCYWNTRKAWFRLRGAQRDNCPCQTYSDSGHALDSRCDAILHWKDPARFRRVCPLLTQTPNGWRCSADAERVRPFWGRAAAYFGAALVVVYFAGTLAVFGILRSAKYDIGYGTVVWPPSWQEIRHSQEKLYATRAQQALAAGNYQEAILSLEMVTKLNPRNYAAGLALAGLSQVAAQPYVSEHIYERLMRDVPEQRVQTAQIWFRTLLARSAYSQIKALAATMLTEDPADRAAWLNALLFASRQTNDPSGLAAVMQANPHLPEWCTEIIEIEHKLLQNQVEPVMPQLTHVHRKPASGYLPYYQVDRLLRHGRVEQAATQLDSYRAMLQPDEASFLRLRIYQAKGWSSLVDTEFDALLKYEMAPRVVAQFCTYLIRYPDAARFARFQRRFTAAALPVNAATIPLHQATYLAAMRCNNPEAGTTTLAGITQFTRSDARVLRGLGELITRPKPMPEQLQRILPLVPLPTEVVYGILEEEAARALVK